MPKSPAYIVGRLFESRFKGGDAIRKILEDSKRTPQLKRMNAKRGPTYVKGIHKGNFFRMRLPSKGRKIPNMPKLPPSQPYPKAPKAMAQQQTQVSTGAIIEAAYAGYYSDFLKRLSRWFKDNWAVLILNVGSICTLVGFTRSDVLELRVLSMTGSVASVVYVMGQPKILWPSVVWSSLFALVNAWKILEIYEERNSDVTMSDDQEKIYVEFFLPHGITPKQFERIEAKAESFELKKGEYLTRRYEKLNHVFLVIEGKTKANILGRHVTALGKIETRKEAEEVDRPPHSGAWVGEMGFLDYYWHKEQQRLSKNLPKKYVPKEAFYTIVAMTDCVIWRWSHENLEDLMGTSNDLRSALTRAMTSSLVSKVVNMTVSKMKDMPTWSIWLSDWAHSAGASVKVSPSAELEENEAEDDDKGEEVEESVPEKDASRSLVHRVTPWMDEHS
eukprot:scaffold1580_cov116-Cylindrotheca_fusiformis.AAC.26